MRIMLLLERVTPEDITQKPCQHHVTDALRHFLLGGVMSKPTISDVRGALSLNLEDTHEHDFLEQSELAASLAAGAVVIDVRSARSPCQAPCV